MRLAVIIFSLTVICTANTFAQGFTVKSTGKWIAGTPVKVTVDLDFGQGGRFARFIQVFPEGIVIEDAGGNDCDITFNGGNLIAVWMRNISGKTSITYTARPENSISGKISVSGRLDIVTATNARETFSAKDFEAEVSSSGKGSTENAVEEKQTSTDRPVSSGGKEFRVQVTASSEQLTADEVRKRTGLSSDQPLSIEKAGNIFKYQFGRFASYSDATTFLSEVNRQGVKGAFIVAYQSGKQVPLK